MNEAKKDEEATPLDSHTPAPPADGTEDSEETPTTEGTPIKPLDSHTP